MQIATPADLCERRRTRFVAEFVGLPNRISGTARDGSVDVLGPWIPLLEGSDRSGTVTALVRPEAVRLEPEPGATAHVLDVSFLGSVCRAQVGLATGELVVAQVSAAEVALLTPGTAVRVSVAPVPVFAAAD